MKKRTSFHANPKNLLVIGWCLMLQEVSTSQLEVVIYYQKIDDDSNSSNFYLNIDLSCQFERDFRGIYTELLIENATIKLYAFWIKKWVLGLVKILLKVSTNDRIVSIIDDELDITELLRDAICGNIDGMSVVTFNDPALALEHFTVNKQDYTLVISDLRMPTLNGLELLKMIKSSSPNVRTILMSAYNFELDEWYQT